MHDQLTEERMAVIRQSSAYPEAVIILLQRFEMIKQFADLYEEGDPQLHEMTEEAKQITMALLVLSSYDPAQNDGNLALKVQLDEDQAQALGLVFDRTVPDPVNFNFDTPFDDA